MHRRRLAVTTGLGLLASALAATGLAHGSAAADTTTTPDPTPTHAVGRHDIGKLVVDNTGARVAVSVYHRGARWTGWDSIGIDTTGTSQPDYLATIPHGTSGSRFEVPGGRSWTCQTRTVSNSRRSAVTTVSMPRSCLSGAPRMLVTVVAHSPHQTPDDATSVSTHAQTRPNILVVMADDMRDDDLDGPWMPNVQRLIESQGVRFANSFAPLPLCCPSRASFVTGQYPHNHGVWTHSDPWGFHALNDAETLPLWLKRAGYHTSFLGKYLNGYGEQSRYGTPLVRDGSTRTYIPPGWDDWRGSLDNVGTYNYWGTHLNHNGTIQDLSGHYQTTAYGRIATHMITTEAASTTPFFTWLSFTAPHHGTPRDPDDPPPEVTNDTEVIPGISTPAVPAYRRDVFNPIIRAAPGAGGEFDMSDKPDFLRRDPLNDFQQAAILEATRQRAEAESILDDQIPRILGALQDAGELQDTLVIFTSDNGYFLGEHRIRQGKIYPYDPSLRVPLLMMGPGIPKGQVRYDPFATIDVAPTLLDLADGQAPDLTNGKPSLDGVSMLDVARSGDGIWTRGIATETGPLKIKTALDANGNPIPYDTTGPNALSYTQGVRTDQYLYIEHADGWRELYDLYIDPRELNSVSGTPEYATTQAELAAVLQQLRTCAGAACHFALPADLQRSSDMIRSGHANDTLSRRWFAAN
jgi:arylsulfatase A-like enzyme